MTKRPQHIEGESRRLEARGHLRAALDCPTIFRSWRRMWPGFKLEWQRSKAPPRWKS
jgi:hypothetical protein